MHRRCHEVGATLLWGLGLSMAGGCATLGSFQSADTVGKGQWEVAVEPSLWGGSSSGSVAAVPHLAVSGRYGASDRVDVGARMLGNGLDGTIKVLLTPPDSDGVVVSLAPTAGGLFALGGAAIFNASLPVLVGIPTSDASQLVIGPRVVGIAGVTVDESDALLLVGSSLGYYASLGGRFAIVPELSVVAPVTGEGSGVLLQIGVGGVLGSGDSP